METITTETADEALRSYREERQRENLDREDLRRLEKVTPYFDEYDRLHEEMERLFAKVQEYPSLSAEAGQLRKEINALREQAYDCIPYGATTPNKTWNGRRA